MRTDVLTSDVRTELLVSVAFAVEDETTLAALLTVPKPPSPKKQAEFERHVEPRQAILAIKRRSGKVVDSVLAFTNQTDELIEPNVCSIVGFERASRDKPAIIHRKHLSTEDASGAFDQKVR